MGLELLFHPLSSFCHKALIALYENATPFEPCIVDLGDPASSDRLRSLWPIAKIPVLYDDAQDRTIPEATIIIEYLDLHYRGATRFLPDDPDLGRQTRLRDRFYDLYVNVPMQKIVTDRIRPAGQNDPYGVAQAQELLRTAYAMIERDMASKPWAMGDVFTMADCAAAPALWYANEALPLAAHPNAVAYLKRLQERPSFARARREAEPYMKFFPR